MSDTIITHKTIHYPVGDLELVARVEIIDEEPMDTAISINGHYCFTVAGCDLEQFIKEFTQIINKYRI